MKATRPYEMRARAEAKAQTRLRILEAVRELAEQTLNLEPTLDAVAARADVSVQTVLRHFGTRDGLLDAALASAQADVADERATAPGDVAAAVDTICAHYERRGDFVMRMLGREHDDARIAAIVQEGRELHRQWVGGVFAPLLTVDGASRDACIDLLVVATDVFTWKLLRRDRKLEAEATANRMRQLVDAVLAAQEAR
jgi:AcrR family transcriptional regulator